MRDGQGHHIIPIVVNKTRSCACKLLASLTSESGFFFFFYFSKKMGRSGDGKRNILLGWPIHFPVGPLCGSTEATCVGCL